MTVKGKAAVRRARVHAVPYVEPAAATLNVVIATLAFPGSRSRYDAKLNLARLLSRFGPPPRITHPGLVELAGVNNHVVGGASLPQRQAGWESSWTWSWWGLESAG